MFDIDKERCVRFTPGKLIRHDYFLPGVAVAGFVLFWRLVYFPWGDSAIDWPSWVQAIGSILAIGVSVWLTNRVHANERQENQRTQALEVIRGNYKAEVLLNEAAVALNVLKKHLIASKGKVVRVDLTRLVNAKALLAEVAVNQPLTERAMRSVALAIEAIETVRSRLDKGREATYSDEESYIHPYLATVSSSRVMVELEYIALCKTHGFGYTKRV